MTTYTITDVSSGMTFPCREDETVFIAIKKTGKGPLRHGCQGGGCGACKIRILSGDYIQCKPMSRKKITEEEERKGFKLACCIQPGSDLVINKESYM